MSESDEIILGGKNQTKLPEVTDEESEEIREFADQWGVRGAKSGGGQGKRLHPVKNESILCDTNPRKMNFKDVAVYPPGYFPVCKRCAYHWRED